LSGGRVANPEDCPGNPRRERLEEEEEEEEEEESLFKADAVNEEDPSATALPRCRRRVLPCYVPEGDSPVSLLATILRE